LIEFKALQTRWRCAIHPGKFCYKQYDEVPPSDHADLDPKALSDWATAIVNKAHFVDLDHPPRGPEWDTILQPRRRKSSSIETPQPYTQPPIHIHMPSHSPRRSPRTPTRRPHVDLTFSSPVLLEHESWAEFDGDGLKAFITHCETKFKATGMEFQEAYLKLRENIYLDVLRGKQSSWYEAQGIKSGTANRLFRTFNHSYAKMQPEP